MKRKIFRNHQTNTYTLVITGLTLLFFTPVLFFLNLFLTENIDKIRDDVIQRIETRSERTITYDSISPSVFQYLEIRNLQVTNFNGERLLEVSKLRINFNIIKYFFSDENPVDNIYLENSKININSEIDEDIINLILKTTGFMEDSDSDYNNSREINKLSIKGKNLSVNVFSDTQNFNLENIFLDLEITPDAFLVDFKSQLNIEKSSFTQNIEGLGSSIRINGISDRLEGSHDYYVEISNLENRKFNMQKQFFNIQFQDNNLRIIKVKDRAPVDIEINYDLAINTISLSGKFDNYIPSMYIDFINEENFDPFLKSAYTGSFFIDYNFETEKLLYSADINTSFPSAVFPYDNMVSLSLNGNESIIDFEKLDIVTSQGSLYYSGLFDLKSLMPEGEVKFRDIKYFKDNDINGNAVFRMTGTNTTEAEVSLSYGKTKFENISLTLRKSGKSFSFNIDSEFPDGAGINISGLYDYRINPEMQIDADFKKINMENIAGFSKIQLPAANLSFLNRFIIDGNISFLTDFTDFTLSGRDLLLNDINNSSNNIKTSFFMNEKSFRLLTTTIQWNQYQGSVSFNAAREETGRYTLNSILILNGQIYNLKGSYFPGNNLIIEGNYETYISVFFDDRDLLFHIFTDKLPVPFEKMTPELTLAVQGRITESGAFKAYFRNNKISNIAPMWYPAGNIDISFDSIVNQDSVSINRLSVTDNVSGITGSGDFLITSFTDFQGWISAYSNTGNEQYLLKLAVDNELFNITADFRGFPVQRLSDADIEGELSGYAVYSGTAENPELLVNIALEKGRVDNNPVSFIIDLKSAAEEIIINKADFKYNLNQITGGKGNINFKTGIYSFDSGTALQRSLDDKKVSSRVSVSGSLFQDISGIEDFFNPDRSIISVFKDGTIDIENTENRIMGFEKLIFSFIKTEQFLSVTGGPGNSFSGRFYNNGIIDITILDPFPITGLISGKIDKNTIDADFSEIYINMQTFGNLLNLNMFKTVRGDVRGNLKISGQLNDPDYYGTLYAANIIAKSAIIPEEIGPFSTEILFQGKNMTIPATTVRVNKAYATAQAEFLFDQWLPADILINVETTPDNRIWIKSNFAAVEVDGFGAGKISIEISGQKVNIEGKLSASRTVIALIEKENTVIRDNDKKKRLDFLVDLEIISGTGVEFYWPSTRIPILRTFAATGQTLNIFADSETGEFLLKGDIGIQGGEVYYFSQSFFLKSGLISFNEDQDKFDPNVTVTAELRERTADNEEVKIILVVDDNPLSRFSPRFESIPPLSQNEILALLGESIYSQFGGERISLGSAILGAGVYSSQLAGILRPFENTIKRILRVDHFSIRTQFYQQASSRETESIGEEEENNLPEPEIFDNYLSNTSIFLGKYFGQYFFLEGLLRFSTLDFDTYQYNYYDVPDFMGLYLKTELSLEVDTPLVLLDITVYPDTNDFFKSFNGTNLQLSWRFSF